ncbi:hypothetical protein ACFU6K_36075 [Kitasatospora sp. NPDC057512]|uniref:hypothetical protein n=1 Tax=Kitasatospora sp. NPDC057512 TaxID=3346154 RepID=UPI0036B622C2
MTVFVCVACDRPITGELTGLPEVPERPMDQGHRRADGSRQATPTVPVGFFAVDPEPWGAPLVPSAECLAVFPGGPAVADPAGPGFLVSGGPCDTVVLHPDDASGLRMHPDWRHVGCCGTTGRGGPNRLCPCGAEVATLVSDCSTPYELHLDPGRVRAVR